MAVVKTTSYRILVVFLFVIVVIVFIYFSYRSPLMLEKKATHIEMKEGAISDIKILLTLKNRGKVVIKNITISDKIPQMGRIKKGADIGALPPSKMMAHDQKGTLLKWEVDHVDPGEERVMGYRIAADLPITGGVHLPSASAKFSEGTRDIKTASKPLVIE